MRNPWREPTVWSLQNRETLVNRKSKIINAFMSLVTVIKQHTSPVAAVSAKVFDAV